MKEALDAKFHDHPGMLRVFPDRGREEEEEEKVIIIADPDDRIKHEISRKYVHENFTFMQAFSSDELLEWLRECSPDVLIVSTELPGIPTAQLVSIVKLIQPGIPVITVTDQHSIEFLLVQLAEKRSAHKTTRWGCPTRGPQLFYPHNRATTTTLPSWQLLDSDCCRCNTEQEP